MKDIVILADFCGPLDGTFNSRFLYLADMLAKDNNVEVVTSDYIHENKKYIDYEIEKHDYKITMLHEGAYPTNVCLRRFLAHFIWGLNVRKYLNSRKKPDVIYCAVPTLTASYEAAVYCRKNGVRFIVDIQDLWPEAFKLSFNVPVISDIVFLPFTAVEDGIYKRADAVCAVSDTYCRRALKVNRRCSKSSTVFLGTDLGCFDGYAKAEPLLKKPEDEIWLAYCGTLGSSYDLTCVFDALRILGDPRIRFIVMGDGPRKAEFESYAEKYGLNVTFTGRLSYDAMCSLLCSCDITVNPIMHNAAQSIINKHADYAASGLPVLSTQENREYRKLVKEYKMGFNCRNNDARSLSDRLRLLADNKALRTQMGRNARRCAEERFDRKRTYLELVGLITGNYH